jgi:hypothetical protein
MAKKKTAKTKTKSKAKTKTKTRKKTKTTATTIGSVVPVKFKIGGVATEAVVKGDGLDTPGLTAVVYTVSGSPNDPTIKVEQPLPDGVSGKTFPITITVLDNATKGSRKVAMMLDGSVVAFKANAIEIVH